ncbi:hypothetical protein [Paludibaculum fermentans]|uniref:Uncharacterized protein n=1 Tax=Paludibaculum fermentans TaxID=1473598 RepID=A0A7S7NPM3_PALFE|nr:hypothetical protein [Paludibaculum fermentans]QOY87467.1 hypothetical protein IRI77_32715 [Paludibaculum fermentans]
MTSLLHNAKQLLETAAGSVEAGLDTGDWTVFIGPQGGLQMVAGADYALANLSADRGASAAWRVSRHSGTVRVEGLAGTDHCVLESRPRTATLHRLLSDVRLYELAA